MLAKFDKILTCVDGSDSSMKAADCAVLMAKEHRAELTALHVVVSQIGYAYSAGTFGFVTPSTIKNLLEKSREEAQKWFDVIEKNASANSVKLKIEVVASPTSEVPAIVDYAEKNNFDLIILGTRGRTGFSKLLLGSVASGVVTYASCPVMVVK